MDEPSGDHVGAATRGRVLRDSAASPPPAATSISCPPRAKRIEWPSGDQRVGP